MRFYFDSDVDPVELANELSHILDGLGPVLAEPLWEPTSLVRQVDDVCFYGDSRDQRGYALVFQAALETLRSLPFPRGGVRDVVEFLSRISVCVEK
nr:MAG TPA: hypothetical protein [Caudoviricetes sp.]